MDHLQRKLQLRLVRGDQGRPAGSSDALQLQPGAVQSDPASRALIPHGGVAKSPSTDYN